MLWEVRIYYKKGVQDPEGETTLQGLKMLGFECVENVKSAKIFWIKGCTKEEVEKMCRRLLANTTSQDYEILKVEE